MNPAGMHAAGKNRTGMNGGRLIGGRLIGTDARALWQLLSLPLRRTPVGGGLALAIYAMGLVLQSVTGSSWLVFLTGAGTWIWMMLAGMALRSILRPETLLLPRFRRHFARVGAVHVALGLLVPVLLMMLVGGAEQALLAASLLLLAMAMGLSMGLGLRVTLVFWLVFVGAGWLPHVTDAVVRAAQHSALAPVAITLLAVLLTSFALRPLLTVRDREADESPMQAVANGRKPAVGADGTPKRRGWVARKLSPLLDGTAQRSLQRALAHMQRQPTDAARMRVIRAVLLPHDNPQAVLINVAAVAVIVVLYILATHATQRWHAGFVGAYAVLIGMSRFSAVGAGMLRMRPNLADLYLTLGPATKREFQALLADTLLWLIAVTLFNCLAYSALIGWLFHAHDLPRLLLAAAITAVGAGFGALAVHLVGPESQTGRVIVQFVVMLGAMALYALVYWLIGRFGVAIGVPAALLVTLPFGIGAWRTARKEYLTRAPCFDAPL